MHRQRPRRNRVTTCLILVLCFLLIKNLTDIVISQKQAHNHEVPLNTKEELHVNNKKDHYDYRIFVFTYARPEGLRVTLSSILNSDYSKARGSTIDLEVFVDYRRDDGESIKNKQAEILDIL
ncbi:uncharacterized protein TM35_000431400, partial [Trypanosoma theileri]